MAAAWACRAKDTCEHRCRLCGRARSTAAMSMPCDSQHSCCAGCGVTSRDAGGHAGAGAAPHQWPCPARIAQTSAPSLARRARHMLKTPVLHPATRNIAVGTPYGGEHETRLTPGDAGMHAKYSRNAPENSGQRRTAPEAVWSCKAPLLSLLLAERCICSRLLLTCTHDELHACTRFGLPCTYNWRHKGVPSQERV